jgi:hypothetical protein
MCLWWLWESRSQLESLRKTASKLVFTLAISVGGIEDDHHIKKDVAFILPFLRNNDDGTPM